MIYCPSVFRLFRCPAPRRALIGLLAALLCLLAAFTPAAHAAAPAPAGAGQTPQPPQPGRAECFALGENFADMENGILRPVKLDERNLQVFVAACTNSLSAAPNDALTQFYLGLSLSAAENYPKARHYLESASASVPLARVAFAELLVTGRGGPTELRRAITLLNTPGTPELPSARLWLGNAYWKMGGRDNVTAALQVWQAAAAQGIVEAHVALGMAYQKGSPNLFPDPRRAEQHFLNAAQQGHIPAMLQYIYLVEDREGRGATFYTWLDKAVAAGDSWAMAEKAYVMAYGENGPANPTAAFKLMELAATRGGAHARLGLADFLRHGIGTSADPAKALAIYLEFAEQGDPAAQYTAGMMLFNGEGAPQNEKRAFFWVFRAVEQGSEEALDWMGRRLIDLTQTAHEEAIWAWGVPMLANWAKNGNPKARYYAAAAQLGQWAQPQQEAAALTALAQLGEEGYGPAMLMLGSSYAAGGKSFDKNPALARSWSERALAAGQPGARAQLAGVLFFDANNDEDRSRAVRLWQEAADKEKDPIAAYMAGEAFHKGIGVPQDSARAVAYLKQSAEAGWPEALYLLGWMYLYGAPGLPSAPKQALAANATLTALYEKLPMNQERLKLVDSLMQAGEFHTVLGNYAEAEKSLNRALQETEPLRGLALEARALIGGQLVRLHTRANQLAKARQALQSMQPLLDQLISETPGNATLLYPYAAAFAEAGAHADAQPLFERMKTVLERNPGQNALLLADIDACLGFIAQAQNAPQKALELLNAANTRLEASGLPRTLTGVRALSALGLVEIELGQVQKGAEHCAYAQNLAQTLGLGAHPLFLDHAGRAAALLAAKGQLNEARALYSRLFAAAVPHFDGSPNTEQYRRMLAGQLDVLIALLSQGGTADPAAAALLNEECFQAIQALAALSSMSGPHALTALAANSPALQSIAQAAQQRRAALEADINRVNQNIFSGVYRAVNASGLDPRTLGDLALALNKELGAQQALRQQAPAVYRFTTNMPLPLHEARELLKAGETLLVFAFGPEHGYAAALTGGKFLAVRLPGLSSQAAKAEADALRADILRGADGSAPWPDFRRNSQFYQKLFAPLEAVFENCPHLYVLSGPELRGLPLEALLKAEPGGEYRDMRPQELYPRLSWLAMFHSVAYLPSVQSLKGLHEGVQFTGGPDALRLPQEIDPALRARAAFLSGRPYILTTNWIANPQAGNELGQRIALAARDRLAPPAMLRRAITEMVRDQSLPPAMAHPAAWAVYSVYGDNREVSFIAGQ